MRRGILRSMIRIMGVCLSVTWAAVLTYSPGGATLVQPLLPVHYSSNYSFYFLMNGHGHIKSTCVNCLLTVSAHSLSVFALSVISVTCVIVVIVIVVCLSVFIVRKRLVIPQTLMSKWNKRKHHFVLNV